MDISDAIAAMRAGSPVRRAIWGPTKENRNWLVFLTAAVPNQPASNFTNAALAALVAALPGGVINVAEVLTLYAPALSGNPGNGSVHFGWSPPDVDVLATDWETGPWS